MHVQSIAIKSKNIDESEKVLRIARLYDKALEVFEDEEAAEQRAACLF